MEKQITQQTPEYGLAIDWETSGAVYGADSSKEHQGLAFGAIVFRIKDFEPVEKMYRMVHFNPKYKWTEGAQKVHGLTREHLHQNGVPQETAAMELASLILKYWGPTGKVMMLGHNAEFDRRFTNQLMNTIGIEFSSERQMNLEGWIQLHHVLLDTSPLGFITLGLFKADLLFKRIGFKDRGSHNALDDIEMTLQTCQVIKSLVDMSLAELANE